MIFKTHKKRYKKLLEEHKKLKNDYDVLLGNYGALEQLNKEIHSVAETMAIIVLKI